jgi:hypothetical protein
MPTLTAAPAPVHSESPAAGVWAEPAGWLAEIPAPLPDGERVEIKGRAYIVNPLPDGDEGERVLAVVKVSSLDTYHVCRQLDGSVTCTCRGFTYGDRCKHATWAMVSGRLAPAPVCGGSPEPEACCVACLPATAPDAPRVGDYLAVRDLMVEDPAPPDAPADGDEPGDDRLDLACAIDAQADAYRAHGTDYGRLLAETLEALARDVRFHGSATPEQYRRDEHLARVRDYEAFRAAEDAAACA